MYLNRYILLYSIFSRQFQQMSTPVLYSKLYTLKDIKHVCFITHCAHIYT